MGTPEQVAGAFRTMLTSRDLRTLIQRVVLTEEAAIRREAPVKRGRLRREVQSRVIRPDRGEVRANAPYARAVEEGTGLYGPKGRKIVPTVKKAMYWKGAAHPVRSVKGQRPNPFVTRGIRAAQPAVDHDMEAWGVKLVVKVT